MKFITSAKTIMVAALLSTTSAQDQITDEDIKTCQGCVGDESGGGLGGSMTNYMCKPPDSTQLKSKGGLVCCAKGRNDEKSFCKPNKDNCTSSLRNILYKWPLACPQATKENCGGHQVIHATGEAQKWGKQNMRLQMGPPPGWKKPSEQKFDICWWIFVPEPVVWKTGKYVIKFTKIGSGMIIMAHGADLPPSVEPGTLKAFDKLALVNRVLDMEKKPEVDKEYTLDIQYGLLMQAIPEDGAQDTDFEFEFKIVGEELKWYEIGHEWLKIQEDPTGTYIWQSISYCLAVIICLGMPLGCCIQGICGGKKAGECDDVGRNQVVDHTQVTDPKHGVPAYDHQTSGQEMELESLDNQSQEKTYQPSNDGQSQNYANPFKKNKQKGH